jgi:hypothetical protein
MPRSRPTLKPVSMPNEVYGAGQDAINAQKAIPLQNAVAQQAPQLSAAPPAAGPPGAMPGAPPISPLDAMTARPNEHVMTGAPVGPGPGPLEAGIAPPADPIAEQLMALYAAHPNDDLGNLIGSIRAGDYSPGGVYGPRAF